MRSVSLDTASQAWDRFFAAAQTSAFKCEVLQDYTAVDMGPSLKAWYEGDRDVSIKLMTQAAAANEWMVAYSARSIAKTRVHLTKTPYTPYLEWEIESYKRSITGEQIFLTDEAKLDHVAIPAGDFWIFDDRVAIEYIYEGSQGNPVGGYVYAEGDDIEHLRVVRDAALEFGSLVELLS